LNLQVEDSLRTRVIISKKPTEKVMTPVWITRRLAAVFSGRAAQNQPAPTPEVTSPDRSSKLMDNTLFHQ
jgi:hypothetical protein